jgi:hypothetical protein
MSTVDLPSNSPFDNDDDSLKDARPQLKTLVDSFNTIANEFNAGQLGATSATALITGDKANNFSNGVSTSNQTTNFTYTGLDDPAGFVTINGDSVGLFSDFKLAVGKHSVFVETYYEIQSPAATNLGTNFQIIFNKDGAEEFARREMNRSSDSCTLFGIVESNGNNVFDVALINNVPSAPQTVTFKEQGQTTGSPIIRILIQRLTTSI